MKISVKENPKIEEIEVMITCPSKNEQVKKILQNLAYVNQTITGIKQGRNFTLTLHQIYYFEVIDNAVFAYTKEDVFEVKMRLYQLEEMLSDAVFQRISKSTLLNIRKVKSFSSSIHGRMEATLLNQEKVIISRTYVKSLKRLLGGKN